MAEVKRHKLDEIFGSIDMYFADTLYDARRVSCVVLVGCNHRRHGCTQYYCHLIGM